MAKIGDVCASKIDTLNAAYNGKIDYIDISAVDNDKKKITNTETLQIKEAPSRARQLVECDDIIVSLVRPNLNAVAVVENSSENLQVASTGYCVLRCNQAVYSRYLFYFCQSETFINRMTAQATGASYPAVSNSIVKNCEIPLPERNKQKEIAEILDKVTGLISLRKQQLAKLDELVKARFVEMFGVVHNSVLYPYVPVKSFTSVVSGGTPNRNVSEFWNNGSIRWVKTTELQNNVICNTDEKITQAGLDNSSAKIIPPNTVLIAMYGQGKTRGMTGYTSIECATNQACACILPCEQFNQNYLWRYMILSYDKLRDMAKGGNQPNLNIGIIKNFPVLKPPIELQNDFAAFVERVDQQKQTVQQSLEKLELMKKALLQEYFG